MRDDASVLKELAKLAAVACVTLTSCGLVGNDDSSVRESEGPAWNASRTSKDGLSVVLVFTGGAEYDRSNPCTVDYRANVNDDDDSVTVGLVAIRGSSTSGNDDIACADLGYPRQLTIQLQQPLGERRLIEARTGDSTPPFDGSRLLQPGWIPDSWIFRGEGMAFPDGDTSETWSQGWGAPTSDESACAPSFALMQGTSAAMGAPADPFHLDIALGTFDINGSPAVRASNAQRFIERLSWIRDDSTIAVVATACTAGAVDIDTLLRFARSIG